MRSTVPFTSTAERQNQTRFVARINAVERAQSDRCKKPAACAKNSLPKIIEG